MRLEAACFGISSAGVVTCLCVVQQVRRGVSRSREDDARWSFVQLFDPAGSAYNVDGVLSEMISGLEAELNDRLEGARVVPAMGDGAS